MFPSLGERPTRPVGRPFFSSRLGGRSDLFFPSGPPTCASESGGREAREAAVFPIARLEKRPSADKRAPSPAEHHFHGPDATSRPVRPRTSCAPRAHVALAPRVARSSRARLEGKAERSCSPPPAVEKKQDVCRRPGLRQLQQCRRPGAPQGYRCRAEHGVQARDPVHGQLRG